MCSSRESAPTMEDCEPRTRLLWSIVGQASSLDWKQPPAHETPPPLNRLHPATADQSPLTSKDSPLTAATLPGIVQEDGTEEEPLAGPSLATQGDICVAGDASEGPGLLCRSDRGFWADLQPELLFLVAAKLASAGAVQAMVGVCM